MKMRGRKSNADIRWQNRYERILARKADELNRKEILAETSQQIQFSADPFLQSVSELISQADIYSRALEQERRNVIETERRNQEIIDSFFRAFRRYETHSDRQEDEYTLRTELHANDWVFDNWGVLKLDDDENDDAEEINTGDIDAMDEFLGGFLIPGT